MELQDLDMEMPREPRRRLRKQSGLDPQKKSLMLGAAGALLLIILLVLFFGAGGGDENPTYELNAVKSRLDGLEKRLALVEGVEPKTSSSETRIKGLQASVNRLESLTRTMKDRMEKLEQAPSPSTPPAKSVDPASVEKRLHEVRRGESLFSIAKKYGMSLDELRRLNHLSRSIIQPGQRLIVDTGV